MDGEEVARLINGAFEVTQVQRTPSGRLASRTSTQAGNRLPEAGSVLSQLRDEHPKWAFLYDPNAQLYHAVQGRSHFVATAPGGPWKRVMDVRL